MIKLEKSLISLESWHEEEQLIAKYIKQKAQDKPLKILEAGCGTKWDQADLLNDISYTLTGIDLDKQALEYRKNKLKDLDRIICGDLREIDFLEVEFDVIFCSFVLEHLDGAEKVLKNFDKWLKPGGLVILRIPDPDTVYGFFSKVTPFWVHIFYSKYLKGYEDAGKPGHGPYPTEFDDVVSRQGIQHFCQSNRWIIREELMNGYFHNESKYSLASKLSRILSFLTIRQLLDSHINLLYVIEKIG